MYSMSVHLLSCIEQHCFGLCSFRCIFCVCVCFCFLHRTSPWIRSLVSCYFNWHERDGFDNPRNDSRLFSAPIHTLLIHSTFFFLTHRHRGRWTFSHSYERNMQLPNLERCCFYVDQTIVANEIRSFSSCITTRRYPVQRSMHVEWDRGDGAREINQRCESWNFQ